MNMRREVWRRFAVWALAVSATVALSLLTAAPRSLATRSEFLSLLLQIVLAGALMALSLFYLCARLNNEKITREIAACMLVGFYLFPEPVWGTLGRVFGGVDPVVSTLLVLTAVFVALNVVVHLSKWDACAGPGERRL